MTYPQDPQDPRLWQTQQSGYNPYQQQPYGAHPPAQAPQQYAPGYPYTPFPQPYVVVPAMPHSGVATASLVLGIIGLCIGWCTFGIPSILAVVLGHLGLSETKDGRRSGRGNAVAGLILGYLLFVPGIILAMMLMAGSLLPSDGPSPSP